MAKIGIIFPYKEMEEMAKPLIAQRELDIVIMKTAQVADVVTEARRAIEAGAEILISRGYEACGSDSLRKCAQEQSFCQRQYGGDEGGRADAKSVR